MAEHFFSMHVLLRAAQHRVGCALAWALGIAGVLYCFYHAKRLWRLRACPCRFPAWSSHVAMPSFPGAGGSFSSFSTSPSRPSSHLHAMATHLLAMFTGVVCTPLVLHGSHSHQMGHITPVQCLPFQPCSRGLSSSGHQKGLSLLVCSTACFPCLHASMFEAAATSCLAATATCVAMDTEVLILHIIRASCAVIDGACAQAPAFMRNQRSMNCHCQPTLQCLHPERTAAGWKADRNV